MRLLFFGTPEFAVPSLQVLVDRGEDVAAVLCQPDRPSGRGQKLTPPPVKVLALRHGLPVLQPEKLRTPEFLATVRELSPELIVVAAYGRILSADLLRLPPRGCINVHGSLLPRHRGAAPIQSAILAGDERTGVTIMQMDEGMDTGAMLLRRDTVIREGETYGELQERLSHLGAAALGEALDALVRGELVPTPQDENAATLAPKISKEQGRIDWTRPAAEIERQVRAFNPWPSAYTAIAGEMLKIHRVEGMDPKSKVPGPKPEDAHSSASGLGPGTLDFGPGGDDLLVGTGTVPLRLLEVQLGGKQRMPGPVFARGARLAPGSRLG